MDRNLGSVARAVYCSTICHVLLFLRVYLQIFPSVLALPPPPPPSAVPRLLMEAALVEAAARLRVSQPDLTALQLHTLIVEQTEFASATLSEVKKASSKASKQLAKMPAETPTPAPALPARSARSANDPHDLAGVFKGYGAAMRRHKRLDVSRGLAALKTALQHCERTQPQDSLIRAALLDKMSMYQWMLDDKASELHTHGDGSDDSDSDASSSPTSSDSSISWLCRLLPHPAFTLRSGHPGHVYVPRRRVGIH